MSLGRFTEQTELKKIYSAYVAAYHANHGKNLPAQFNDMIITTAIDGAGVNFCPDSTLFDEDENRVKNGSIAKQISQRLIDCIAYYLAQKVSVKNVPETMRICMSVCHNNVHWTGLVVELGNFQDIYQSFDQYCKKNQLSFGDSNTHHETIIHNNAKNAILRKLGAVDNYNNPTLKEVTKTQHLFNAIKTDDNAQVNVYHFDSMNDDFYNNRIKESLAIVVDNTNHVNLIPYPCSYQRSNTCGDHTVYNVFSFGHFRALASLNRDEKDSLSSKALRKLTDDLSRSSLDESSIREQATRFVTAVPSNVSETKNKPIRNKYHFIVETTAELVEKIHKVTKSITPSLIQELRTDALRTVPLFNKQSLIDMINNFNATQDKSENKITYDEALFSDVVNLKKLFPRKRDLEEFKSITDDAIALSALAACAAGDLCSEIEHQQLRAELSESSLMKQQIALDEYSKRSSSCETSSETPGKSSPTLFGDFHSATSTPLSNSSSDTIIDEILADLEEKTNPKPASTSKQYVGRIVGTILGTLIGAGIGVASIFLAPFTLGGSLIIGSALIIGLATLVGGTLGFSCGFAIDRWRRHNNSATPTMPGDKNSSTKSVYGKRVDGADLSPRISRNNYIPPPSYPPVIDDKKKVAEAPTGEQRHKPKR